MSSRAGEPTDLQIFWSNLKNKAWRWNMNYGQTFYRAFAEALGTSLGWAPLVLLIIWSLKS